MLKPIFHTAVWFGTFCAIGAAQAQEAPKTLTGPCDPNKADYVTLDDRDSEHFKFVVKSYERTKADGSGTYLEFAVKECKQRTDTITGNKVWLLDKKPKLVSEGRIPDYVRNKMGNKQASAQ